MIRGDIFNSAFWSMGARKGGGVKGDLFPPLEIQSYGLPQG